jgi:isopenicillin-N N-acyltransferase-like protein
MYDAANMITPFPLIEVSGPPRETVNGTMTATVAMIVMEPALGIMEVAPLPALNRQFTTYRLEAGRPAPVTV